MTARLPVTLPAYTPTSWELALPGYPVISGSFRSAFFPEILGSLPSESRWTLKFENKDNTEALALLLPWRATAGGLWPLTELPPELAGGVNDANFRKRLTGTTWTIASKPTATPVKNGRFDVTIELIYELTLESRYGPRNPPQDLGANPVLLGMTGALTVVGLPVALVPLLPIRRSAGPVLGLGLESGLAVAGLPVSIAPLLPISRSAGPVVTLGLESGLTVVGVNPVKA